MSGCYRFTSDTGEVFTLYDWKATTLYYGEDTDRDWPTPAAFWADTETRELNIGGRGEENDDGLNLAATAFREWLLEQYYGYRSGLVN